MQQAMFCCVVSPSPSPEAFAALDAVARACSPRIAKGAGRASSSVIFDISGLTRVVGPPPVIAAEVERLCGSHGLAARIAIAGTMTAAWLLAQAGASAVTVVRAG